MTIHFNTFPFSFRHYDKSHGSYIIQSHTLSYHSISSIEVSFNLVNWVIIQNHQLRYHSITFLESSLNLINKHITQSHKSKDHQQSMQASSNASVILGRTKQLLQTHLSSTRLLKLSLFCYNTIFVTKSLAQSYRRAYPWWNLFKIES